MSNTYVNKVIYGNTTLIDISDTTTAATDVASGKIFYGASGEQLTGTLAFQTIYSGSSAPTAATGVNGDIYIQTA